jgi:hypothetical protein
MNLVITVDSPELTDIQQKLERLIEMAQLTQAQIDALTTAISTATTNIRADIDDLKSRIPPDVDTSALDASVAALEALDVENPPPVPPA